MALSALFLGAAVSLELTAGSVQQNGDSNAAYEVWGGQDAQLSLNTHGASVEFDCAEGEISQPIIPDAKGEFTAQGTYTPGQFGPIRQNSHPQKLPATYKGKISGEAMHLQVIPKGKGMQAFLFILTKGKEGRLVRCH
jgi:hypothetical protein